MSKATELEKSSEVSEDMLKKYYDLNLQKRELEKEMNQIKKQIHNYLDVTFRNEQKGEVKRGKYKAQRTIRSSISYDEEKTVQKLEELNLEDFILQVKQPDTEKLEAAIKIDIVKEEDFKDCKLNKRSQAITVKELSI
ncbi:hypothetical protein JCM21714_4014 [Gracilibacillus boraciitolerans JCM 21714]|uniref:Uncharacterized protein n=1 Tax=Gracilibacillus boraciitolerans JCM 21714 TaxID=1298598 RepID=W4VN23_9BACI|nr:hypothetical protein [Gracilibacillus boraciitolerans]GAE94820.1 hypothetical protein JCM21714_4014 [Gracilibacillus boraciitolerans JCM 21714]